MDREETNKVLRNRFDSILNRELTEREKEIREIARKEKEEYEKRKAAFYNNPLHWSNNKRRMHGLHALRGSINKCRSKRYPSYRPTAHLFCTIEDMLDEIISSELSSNKFFNNFVEFKSLV